MSNSAKLVDDTPAAQPAPDAVRPLDPRPAWPGEASQARGRSVRLAGGRSRSRRLGQSARAWPVSVALACLVVAVIITWAAFPELLAPHSAWDPSGASLEPPSAKHLFGTDLIGRDQLARVIFGARESLLGAALAVTLGLVAGITLGTIAGAAGGVADQIVMRAVDVLLAVPALLAALVVVVLLGRGTTNAALAVGIGSVAGFARLVRAEVVKVRHSEYVEAAYSSGGSFATVLIRHILPNSLRPVLALLPLQLGGAILALATLGFLGYGVQPPDPEWGMMIADGRNLLGSAPWITAFPGLLLAATVLATHRLSRSLGGRS